MQTSRTTGSDQTPTSSVLLSCLLCVIGSVPGCGSGGQNTVSKSADVRPHGSVTMGSPTQVFSRNRLTGPIASARRDEESALTWVEQLPDGSSYRHFVRIHPTGTVFGRLKFKGDCEASIWVYEDYYYLRLCDEVHVLEPTIPETTIQRTTRCGGDIPCRTSKTPPGMWPFVFDDKPPFCLEATPPKARNNITIACSNRVWFGYAVHADATGGIVAWVSLSDGKRSVHVQRFDGRGQPVGEVMRGELKHDVRHLRFRTAGNARLLHAWGGGGSAMFWITPETSRLEAHWLGDLHTEEADSVQFEDQVLACENSKEPQCSLIKQDQVLVRFDVNTRPGLEAVYPAIVDGRPAAVTRVNYEGSVFGELQTLEGPPKRMSREPAPIQVATHDGTTYALVASDPGNLKLVSLEESGFVDFAPMPGPWPAQGSKLEINELGVMVIARDDAGAYYDLVTRNGEKRTRHRIENAPAGGADDWSISPRGQAWAIWGTDFKLNVAASNSGM